MVNLHIYSLHITYYNLNENNTDEQRNIIKEKYLLDEAPIDIWCEGLFFDKEKNKYFKSGLILGISKNYQNDEFNIYPTFELANEKMTKTLADFISNTKDFKFLK